MSTIYKGKHFGKKCYQQEYRCTPAGVNISPGSESKANVQLHLLSSIFSSFFLAIPGLLNTMEKQLIKLQTGRAGGYFQVAISMRSTLTWQGDERKLMGFPDLGRVMHENYIQDGGKKGLKSFA